MAHKNLHCFSVWKLVTLNTWWIWDMQVTNLQHQSSMPFTALLNFVKISDSPWFSTYPPHFHKSRESLWPLLFQESWLPAHPQCHGRCAVVSEQRIFFDTRQYQLFKSMHLLGFQFYTELYWNLNFSTCNHPCAALLCSGESARRASATWPTKATDTSANGGGRGNKNVMH